MEKLIFSNRFYPQFSFLYSFHRFKYWETYFKYRRVQVRLPMKKRTIAIIILAVILLILGGLYWLGYMTFNGYLPSFSTNPDTTQPDTPPEEKESPQLTIDRVKGRFNKIVVDIKNIGVVDARTVNWSVMVKGGILKRIDHRSSGIITTLPKGSTATIVTDRIPLGFGRLDITITVETSQMDAVTQSATGFKLFFLVIGVRT